MPAQDKLMDKIKETPPDTFAELEAMMADCGYGVTVTDPGAADDSESADDMGPEEEAVSDDGDLDVEEVSPDDIPEDIKAMLKTMLGGKDDHSKHDLSHGGRNKMRVKVARIALEDNKKGDSYE